MRQTRSKDHSCPCCEKHGLHLRDKRANSPFPAETGSLIKLQAREKFNSLPEVISRESNNSSRGWRPAPPRPTPSASTGCQDELSSCLVYLRSHFAPDTDRPRKSDGLLTATGPS